MLKRGMTPFLDGFGQVRLSTNQIWGNVFNYGPSKIYGRQPVKF